MRVTETLRELQRAQIGRARVMPITSHVVRPGVLVLTTGQFYRYTLGLAKRQGYSYEEYMASLRGPVTFNGQEVVTTQ